MTLINDGFQRRAVWYVPVCMYMYMYVRVVIEIDT